MTTSANAMTTAAPVNIRADIIRQIDGLAAQQHIQIDTFINEILEQYLAQTPQKPSRDAAFLLSLAGMFDSGGTATSEHVHEIVSEAVVEKYAKQGAS